MDFVFFLFIFFFGLIMGSFFTVLIDRIPRGESIVKGRSYCENCKKKLAVRDLIPVLSFLLLSGKCRYCHAKLSFYYPLVEILTGILFVFAAFYAQNLFQVFYYVFVVSIFVIIFFTDLKYGIIPFSIIFPAIIISFVSLLFTPYLLPNAVLAALGAFLFFLFLFLVTRGRGMGFGDVVYVFWMGLLLGWPAIIVGMYIAFLTGAAVSLVLIAIKRKHWKGSTVPFGPFLVLGTLVGFFWGNALINLTITMLQFTIK